MLRWWLTVLMSLVVPEAARAAPPPGADPALAPWFHDLRVPGSGISCCSMADCRPTEYRSAGDHYEVLVQGHWISVPPDRVLHRNDNPTGSAVLCWTPNLGVICFVQGPET